VLGRARWRVLVLDDGSPRNQATHEMHGVLGHDGLDPAELRARGRAELSGYGVQVVPLEVEGAELLDGSVRVTSPDRTEVARTLLLATGMLDELPDIPGFADVWGTSAHTCPHCDGFEHRDERLAVLAAGDRGEHLAVLLRQWSDDVVLLSNGPHNLAADQLARVQAVGVPVIETPVVRLDSDNIAEIVSTTGRARCWQEDRLQLDGRWLAARWRHPRGGRPAVRLADPLRLPSEGDRRARKHGRGRRHASRAAVLRARAALPATPPTDSGCARAREKQIGQQTGPHRRELGLQRCQTQAEWRGWRTSNGTAPTPERRCRMRIRSGTQLRLLR
jgi:hypothetical protein